MSRVAILFSFLVLTVTAAGQVQSLGEISFAVPNGWEYEGASSADRVTFSISQDGQVVAMAVFTPLRATGNPDGDFRAAWAKVVRSMQSPEPIYEHKSLAGYQGRYGSTVTSDGSHYVHLYLLQAGERTIPVLVITPNRQVFNILEP